MRGEALIASYEAPLLREPPRYRTAFCRVCGSPLPVALEGTDAVALHAGTLDAAPGDEVPRAARHLFVGQAAPWDAPSDDLPRFEGRAAQPGRRSKVGTPGGT